MRTLIATSQIHPRDSFEFWQTAIFERFAPIQMNRIGVKPFEGMLEVMDVGPLSLTRITQTAMRIDSTPEALRGLDKQETVSVVLMLSGSVTYVQGGRESVQRSGELMVLDRKLATKLAITETKGHNRALTLDVPRERLERMLGPVSQYAGLTVGSDQATTSLATNFFDGLTRIQGQLSPDLAERLSTIGIDLLVASLSERMGRETPRPLASMLLVRRAKAYVAAHLSDPTLDPPQLAIAMGVSLRRLQQLFQGQGENIGEWIWQRRLELAAVRLSDPGSIGLSLGTLAYDCGFVSQSHFSKRFKDHHGMTPSEYRASAISKSYGLHSSN